MAQKAKVFNRDNKDYTVEFPKGSGKRITIPANGSIIMTRSEAVQLKGSYPGKGVVARIKIELIPDPNAEKAREPKICNMCGLEFASDKELYAHLRGHGKSEEQTDMVGDVMKRGPGRPKGQNDSSSSSRNNKETN